MPEADIQTDQEKNLKNLVVVNKKTDQLQNKIKRKRGRPRKFAVKGGVANIQQQFRIYKTVEEPLLRGDVQEPDLTDNLKELFDEQKDPIDKIKETFDKSTAKVTASPYKDYRVEQTLTNEKNALADKQRAMRESSRESRIMENKKKFEAIVSRTKPMHRVDDLRRILTFEDIEDPLFTSGSGPSRVTSSVTSSRTTSLLGSSAPSRVTSSAKKEPPSSEKKEPLGSIIPASLKYSSPAKSGSANPLTPARIPGTVMIPLGTRVKEKARKETAGNTLVGAMRGHIARKKVMQRADEVTQELIAKKLAEQAKIKAQKEQVKASIKLFDEKKKKRTGTPTPTPRMTKKSGYTQVDKRYKRSNEI